MLSSFVYVTLRYFAAWMEKLADNITLLIKGFKYLKFNDVEFHSMIFELSLNNFVIMIFNDKNYI